MFWQKRKKLSVLVLGLSLWQGVSSQAQEESQKEVQEVQGPQESKTEEIKNGETKNDEAPITNDTEGMDRIEREKYEPRISNKWFRGSYLIYDCQRGNFVCVNYQGFVRCGEERDEDKKKSRPALRCAAFKKFKTQEACFKEQYRQIENQKPKVFCMNPKYY